MAIPPPPDAKAARFREDVAALAGGAPIRLGLAVSGGPDSLALLLLARTAFPGQVYAATVDHGLRPESPGEARFVAGICETLGVPHAILSAGRPPEGASVQARARALRYRLLADWADAAGLSHVATAHHADDQAETLLMRLARGSGLPGLAGIRAQRMLRENSEARLVRPLLDWRRAELVSLVEQAGLTAVDDPSNREARFDRTRFRTLLAASGELDPARLAEAALHLADCEAALAWAAEAAWSLRAVRGAELEIDVSGLPREIARRLARRAIETIRGERGIGGEWREDGLDRLLDTLASGGRATLAGILCSGGAAWRFRPAPPRRERSR